MARRGSVLIWGLLYFLALVIIIVFLGNSPRNWWFGAFLFGAKKINQLFSSEAGEESRAMMLAEDVIVKDGPSSIQPTPRAVRNCEYLIFRK
ncbi:MAG: hypothetical protein WCD23_14170, partial [Candidatus Acidiferrales bacterium]